MQAELDKNQCGLELCKVLVQMNHQLIQLHQQRIQLLAQGNAGVAAEIEMRIEGTERKIDELRADIGEVKKRTSEFARAWGRSERNGRIPEDQKMQFCSWDGMME